MNTEQEASCEPLLELAIPGIYRRNLFRVLGLPLNATPKDVQRQESRRKMQAKLGVSSSNGKSASLGLDSTDEESRAAMERLTRPRDRLLDEVFWFWPAGGVAGNDPGLKALEQGDLEAAKGTWAGHASGGCIATHNLAVLYHLSALDQEKHLASSGSSNGEVKGLSDIWHYAFARWKEVIEGEAFWSKVKDRVREVNDAQLPTGFVRRVRSTLPMALLLINAKIACAAAERSDTALAQQHLGLIREAKFGEGLADRAIQEALKPVRNRLKTAMDKAKSGWTSKPHQGNRSVRQLHEQAKGLLAVVDAMLPADNLARGGMHDMVADAMLDGQIAFGNKTNEWAECIKLLELALELNPGEAIRTRLTKNIETLKDNAKSANDWCSPGYWDLPEEIVGQLEAAREKSRAGNHEGAIKALVALDPKIGAPLRRCVAFSLSQRGWQIANKGIEEFNSKAPGNIQKFLEVIRRKGTVSVPNSNMSSWQLPDCPCCGRSSYTQWRHGEYDGQKFWMCSSCAASDDVDRQKLRGELKAVLSEGLKYLLIAVQIDKNDSGLRNSLKSMKTSAEKMEVQSPPTLWLRKKLGIRFSLLTTPWARFVIAIGSIFRKTAGNKQ